MGQIPAPKSIISSCNRPRRACRKKFLKLTLLRLTIISKYPPYCLLYTSGVLAGTYRFGIGAIFSSLPRPSDGVVLLDETRLQGVRDHVTFRLNHFGMLFSKRCCAQVARFLATGTFAHVPARDQVAEAPHQADFAALLKKPSEPIFLRDLADRGDLG